jgi:nucleotide-binding universal stress UspA family protein
MSQRIQSIVVATDFSEHAERAVLRAAQLAAEHGARLELVHAAPMPMPMPVWGDMAGGTWIENSELIAVGEQRLQRQRNDLLAQPQHPAEVSVHCEAAPPQPLVLARAEAQAADLIVIGATGEGALAQRLFGSTAQSIVRHARRPVLVARLPVIGPYHRLLIASDFSDDALRIARQARALAPQARVDLFSALENPRFTIQLFYGPDEATRQANLERARAAVRERLATLAAELGVADAPLHLRDGRASHELAGVLAESGADLLSVGAHGKTRLEAGVLGSTSLHAVAEAGCDVLVGH